ncbi:flagellar FliL protein [Azospirillum fermentarium]|uniref:flagellar basal body-associated FliL family protein n=1 Tax=Azospirillum fermentarium TaxID=1233114 RepID=UPI0022260017|nr:flagellar basal body-associated FliL family protein [Azospirillum fermentarium]MCW2247046.1 flagellar FliL protein [Azospirillum fermentarium]
MPETPGTAAAPVPPPPVPFPPRPLPSARLRAEREVPPPALPAERSPLRLILMLVAALACLAGLGWGTATVFGIGPVKPSRGISQAAAGHIYVKMPAMEFAMPDGLRFRQLRVRLVLEMPGDVDRDLIASYVPRIANTVSSRMADVGADDLNGAEGVTVVKSVVAHAANQELRPLRVRKVLVQEMLLR